MRNPVLVVSAAAALAALAVCVLPAERVTAQDAGVKAKAREVLAANKDAVVHVKAAVKMSFGGMDNDQQVEAVGTVIDASGLTVMSEGSLNPAGMFEMMGMGEGMDIKSDVGDVKLVMSDGKEVPARVVLRDKDLDLAFLVPTEKGGKYAFVSLDAAKAPAVLDDVIIVGRLGRNLDRTPTLASGQVSAVVKKPRTFYVVNSGAGGAFATGCPTFDAAGKLLGIFLQRRGASGGGGGISEMISNMMPVILPAADVKEVSVQALAEAAKAPVEEKKAEEPKQDEPAPEEKKDGEKKGEEPKTDTPK